MHYVTAGESHGPWEIAIIEGFPAGLKITEEEINSQLKRRQRGYGRGSRQKIENDQVKFLSGVRHQRTLGSPITLAVKNLDHDNWQEIMSANTPADLTNTRRQVLRPRPGHADLVGAFKYREHEDLRNILERSSARETTMRVAVGAICKKLLQELQIDVLGFVCQIGSILTPMEDVEKFKSLAELRAQSESFSTRTLDDKTDQAMRKLIDQAKKSGDTLGGTVMVLATGVPAGLGSYVSAQTKLDAKIARAIVSINAFKGVEFGDGFQMAGQMGSELMDEIFWSKERGFYRATNHLGGFEGGMTTGEMLVIRGLVKPIPTLYRPEKSVDLKTHKEHSASIERSDTTAVTVGAVIAEAMVAIELAKEILAEFNADHLERLKEQVASYRKELRIF
jgi:chorismate synthase